MNGLLLVVALIMLAGVILIAPSDGGASTLVALPIASLAAWFIYRPKIDHRFLARLFAAGLVVRFFVGTIIFALHQPACFCGEALTYGYFRSALMNTLVCGM